jgi:hypothetical protein
MIDGWLRKGVLVAVLAAAVVLGRINGAAPVGNRVPDARTAQTQEQLHRELFLAVRTWLTDAHVAKQDMPKRIISVERMGSDRYKVRMEMVQGEGWFEVSRDGAKWRVQGLPVPSRPGGGGGP